MLSQAAIRWCGLDSRRDFHLLPFIAANKRRRQTWNNRLKTLSPELCTEITAGVERSSQAAPAQFVSLMFTRSAISTACRQSNSGVSCDFTSGSDGSCGVTTCNDGSYSFNSKTLAYLSTFSVQSHANEVATLILYLSPNKIAPNDN